MNQKFTLSKKRFNKYANKWNKRTVWTKKKGWIPKTDVQRRSERSLRKSLAYSLMYKKKKIPLDLLQLINKFL